jgi:hypothetical protein
MLLIEHDAMGDVSERIKELEQEEQEKALNQPKSSEMPESV